jgi:hypothetical protein
MKYTTKKKRFFQEMGREITLHKTDNAGELTRYSMRFLNLIPGSIHPAYKQNPADFSRNRKLSFPKLVTFLLSVTASGKCKGIDSKSGEFFKNARRSGLWPDAAAIHRSAFTKARRKVSWKVFRNIFKDAIRLAYSLWPKCPGYNWENMSVFAFDGSIYTLPGSREIRREFTPAPGPHETGYYPQCLVTTAFDVFRRFPVARTITAKHGSERKEALKLLPHIPQGNLLLFDRGYPSFDFLNQLLLHYSGYFLLRTPARFSFKEIETFVKSGKTEEVINILPPAYYLSKFPHVAREKIKPLQLRVLRLESHNKSISVLLTNLLDRDRFTSASVRQIYFKRWELESYYRDEKVYLDIDTFHSRTVNGILQELYAAAIMSVISRTLILLSSLLGRRKRRASRHEEPQFKHAVMTLAAEAAVLAPDNRESATRVFRELLVEIRRVLYYRPKTPRPFMVRVSKKPVGKWVALRLRYTTTAGSA